MRVDADVDDALVPAVVQDADGVARGQIELVPADPHAPVDLDAAHGNEGHAVLDDRVGDEDLGVGRMSSASSSATFVAVITMVSIPCAATSSKIRCALSRRRRGEPVDLGRRADRERLELGVRVAADQIEADRHHRVLAGSRQGADVVLRRSIAKLKESNPAGENSARVWKMLIRGLSK